MTTETFNLIQSQRIETLAAIQYRRAVAQLEAAKRFLERRGQSPIKHHSNESKT